MPLLILIEHKLEKLLGQLVLLLYFGI